MSEFNYDDALKRAASLDQYYRVHQRPLGPLHGLPVSLMDRFNVTELDSTCGYISCIGKIKKEADEGVLVKQLRSLGAIIFCKTAVPMGAMTGETDNNITGFVMNPYNRMLSAGGACGGEGALIALRGSPMGFGTDIAGSARIPAVFNGLYSLKTSEHRLPQTGLVDIFPGLPTATGSIGMLSNDIVGIRDVFRAILDAEPWRYDSCVLELPWRQKWHDHISARCNTRPGYGADGRLVFGVLSSDNHVTPHIPVQKALETVRNVLLANGHEVFRTSPSIILLLMSPDRGLATSASEQSSRNACQSWSTTRYRFD